MSYSSAIQQLNAMAPELFTAPGQPRRKFSLDEFATLLDALGNPHRRFRSVLIAGTNGKGSTAATLASILAASGTASAKLCVGLYTSPHLERVNERIRIGSGTASNIRSEEIPDDTFARLYFRVYDTAQQLVLAGMLPQPPSFFEILTAQAFLYFAEQQVDIAVLEVGMGGRLDATNIVDPLLSIITDIALDHTEWLGSTLAAIAREKAGILRPNGTLITLPQHPEANQALGEVTVALEVKGINAAAFMPQSTPASDGSYFIQALGESIHIASTLTGLHQQRNIALAIAAAVELATAQNFSISPAAIANGIRNTRWPGRLEHITTHNTHWILDVAHNPAGAWALRSGISTLLAESKTRTLIFSCLQDKPIAEMAQILFPLFDKVIFAPIHSVRATSMQALEAAAASTGTPCITANSVAQALDLTSAPNGLVVISGSVYLVGEARSILLSQESAG